MYGEQSLSCLPRFWHHELLSPSAAQQEKSIDVHFISPYLVQFATYKSFKESQGNTRVYSVFIYLLTCEIHLKWCVCVCVCVCVSACV